MQTPQIRGEGEYHSGLFTSGIIPESLLKRGIDRLGQMAFITRGFAALSNVLHTRFPSGVTVDTREHKVYEISELDRVFTVTVDSTTASAGLSRPHSAIGLTNAQAAQLQPNDGMIFKNTYKCVVSAPAQYGIATTGTSPTLVSPPNNVLGGRGAGYIPSSVVFSRSYGLDANGNYMVEYEQAKILRITPNHPNVGYGNSLVEFDRCICSANQKDMGGARIPVAMVDAGITACVANGNSVIQTGDTILRQLPIFKEGTDAPNGFTKNPELDNNFTQEFKYALEQTNESDIESLWSSKKPIDINRMLLRRRMMMDIERAYMFGQKSKFIDAEGRVEYTMGGVVEFILKDKDHILTYKQPNLSWQGLLDIGKEVFVLGGGQDRDCFVGYSLETELRKMFYETGYMRYNPEASKAFNIEVNTINTTGGRLNIIPSYVMEEQGWGMRMLCLDFSTPAFVPVTHNGWDMKVEKNIQLPGQQIYKEQVIGIKGLERRSSQYQCIIDFPI